MKGQPIEISEKEKKSTKEELLKELDTFKLIVEKTDLCKSKSLHEPSWNTWVHSPMLDCLVNRRPEFPHYDVTTVQLIAELAPTSPKDTPLPRRKIDYVVVMTPPLFDPKALVTRLKASQETSLQHSINPAVYDPLNDSPIVMMIETKADGNRLDNINELSVWILAYFRRLHLLVQAKSTVALPCILILGQSWTLFFAIDNGPDVDLFEIFEIGTTADIVGNYKILWSLRQVCNWIERHFVPWFNDKVLLMPLTLS